MLTFISRIWDVLFTFLRYPLVICKTYLYMWLFMIAFHRVSFLNVSLDSQSDSSSATCEIVREARQQVLYVILAAFDTLISALKVLWTSDFQIYNRYSLTVSQHSISKLSANINELFVDNSMFSISLTAILFQCFMCKQVILCSKF